MVAVPSSYHVLLVDSDAADAALTVEILAQGSIGGFTISRVATLAAAGGAFAEFSP